MNGSPETIRGKKRRMTCIISLPAYGDYPFPLERKTVHLHPASEPWRDGAETHAGISKTREIKEHSYLMHKFYPPKFRTAASRAIGSNYDPELWRKLWRKH